MPQLAQPVAAFLCVLMKSCIYEKNIIPSPLFQCFIQRNASRPSSISLTPLTKFRHLFFVLHNL